MATCTKAGRVRHHIKAPEAVYERVKTDIAEFRLLRWYASCCNTPIGNTLATQKFSFIGLVHSCLEGAGAPLDDAFGPVRAWVNANSAKGDPKPKVRGLGTTVGWFLTTTLKARLNGSYKQTPFFRTDTGAPVVSPRVLSSEEHARVMDTVQAAPR